MPEIILKSNGRQGFRLLFYLNSLFGFDCLVKTFRISPPKHEPAGKLVYNNYFSFFDYVIAVQAKQSLSTESYIGMVAKLDLTVDFLSVFQLKFFETLISVIYLAVFFFQKIIFRSQGFC